MKSPIVRYLLASLLLFVVVTAIVIATSGKESSKVSHEQTTTSTTTTTVPVPTFAPTEASEKIPNPCEVISIEHVGKVLENPAVVGPIFQDAVAPSKKCEWVIAGEKYPRLGVTVVLSKTFFDASEEKKISDVTFGDEAFIVDDFVTGFGGTSCGETLIVKQREYSYSVAVCKEKDEKPSEEELIELATDVTNSLP